MEKPISEISETSEAITTLSLKLNGLSDRDYSPNHITGSLNDNPSNSSPKAPDSDKSFSFENTSPKKKDSSSKIQTIVESLVDEQNADSRKETNDKINEIDSYITKLLEKLKCERQRISDLEATRNSLRSLTTNDKERQQEQENLEPITSIQDSPGAITSNKTKVLSIRSERAQRERVKVSEQNKKISINVLEPFKGQKCLISDILEISTRNINFGFTMPGRIVEESLDLTNNSNEDIVVQICVDCINSELNDTEEYIYSIRRSHLFDYNDKHYLIMSPHSSASFKITLKVPNTKSLKEIQGQATIAVRGVKGEYKILLNSVVTIPTVICPKELYQKEGSYKVIKLAIKQGKKQESKFPLRNLSDVPISLDLNFYQPKNIEEDSKFQCLLHPSVVNIPPQGTVMVNITLKSLKTLGRIETDNQKSFKKVLVGNARNSTLIYSFLLWVEIC